MKDQKQLENEEYFYYLGSMTTNYARCTPEIKLRITAAKAAFNEKVCFTCKFNVTLRNKLLKCYIWAWLCMVLKLGEFGKLS